MATPRDEKFRGYPVPANGGRAPGGPFDLMAADARAAAINAGPPAPTKTVVADQPSRFTRGSMPAMGALAADMNVARGMSLYRPISEGVHGGAAGPAVDRARGLARQAATSGMNLPGTSLPPRVGVNPTASELDAAGVLKPKTATTMAAGNNPTMGSTPQRDPAVPTIATATPPAMPGTTAGAVTNAPTPATSISGRTLGYGKNIDGVRVFSDGSGASGIPRTMSNETIQALGQRNVADPGVTGIFSPTTGLQRAAPGTAPNDALARENLFARTLTQDQGVEQRMALTRNAGQGPVFHMPDAGTMAMHDAAAFANRDTRSAAGRAGDALYRAAQPSGFTTRASRKAAGQAFADGASGIAAGGIKRAGDEAITSLREQGEAARSNMREAGEWGRANLNAQAGLAQEAMRLQGSALSRTLPQINLEDGTVGLLGPDGTVRQAMGADGKPVRTLQQREDAATKRSTELYDGIGKAAADILKNSVAYGEQATPEQISQARINAARLNGLRVYENTNPNGGPTLVEINGEYVPL